MAVRIRLLRMGKIRNPQYRIVVADSRTKRDGRAIEQLGLYHPKEEPSRIEVKSDRVQHWLSVGAQPSVPVIAILSRTGDWQKFKGLPPPAEPLKVAPARADRKAVYEAEAKAAAGIAEAEAKPKKEAPAKATKSARAKAEAPPRRRRPRWPRPRLRPKPRPRLRRPRRPRARRPRSHRTPGAAAETAGRDTGGSRRRNRRRRRPETPATPGEESTGAGDTQG